MISVESVETASPRWTSAEVCAESGLTYRRLDYLTTHYGVFDGVSDPEPGSGNGRTYSARDLALAKAIGELHRCGVDTETIVAAIRAMREGTFLPMAAAFDVLVDVVLEP